MFLNKSIEYWLVLIGMVFYASAKDAEKEPLIRRLAKVAASAFLALGLSSELAPYLRGSETAATVCVMGFGLIALDVMTALLSDREFIKDVLRKRLGGGGRADE